MILFIFYNISKLLKNNNEKISLLQEINQFIAKYNEENSQ